MRVLSVTPDSLLWKKNHMERKRLPLFALDLRTAPAWFRQSRGSRQIGATYPEGEPYASISNIVPAEAYDAVLFVEATTVARKNPGR